jgi:hypothetical protein
VLSGFASICGLMVNIIGCSPTAHPNLVVIDPAKRSDTWALERADIDCKAQVRSEKWFDHLRLRHRVDPIMCRVWSRRDTRHLPGRLRGSLTPVENLAGVVEIGMTDFGLCARLQDGTITCSIK